MADDFIGLRVEPERKESWQEAVEELPEYRDLSHLIIHAVDSELRETPSGGVDRGWPSAGRTRRRRWGSENP